MTARPGRTPSALLAVALLSRLPSATRRGGGFVAALASFAGPHRSRPRTPRCGIRLHGHRRGHARGGPARDPALAGAHRALVRYRRRDTRLDPAASLSSDTPRPLGGRSRVVLVRFRGRGRAFRAIRLGARARPGASRRQRDRNSRLGGHPQDAHWDRRRVRGSDDFPGYPPCARGSPAPRAGRGGGILGGVAVLQSRAWIGARSGFWTALGRFQGLASDPNGRVVAALALGPASWRHFGARGGGAGRSRRLLSRPVAVSGSGAHSSWPF
jgi:hypothetical protein